MQIISRNMYARRGERGQKKRESERKKIVTNGIEYKLSVRNGARYSFAYGTCSFTHPKPESMDEKYAVCLLSSFNSMNICNVVQWMRRGRKKKKIASGLKIAENDSNKRGMMKETYAVSLVIKSLKNFEYLFIF